MRALKTKEFEMAMTRKTRSEASKENFVHVVARINI
jgi:hypothetical protein